MGVGTQMETQIQGETQIQMETRTQILCMRGENEVKFSEFRGQMNKISKCKKTTKINSAYADWSVPVFALAQANRSELNQLNK